MLKVSSEGSGLVATELAANLAQQAAANGALPMARPASPWHDAAVLFTDARGNLVPYVPGTNVQHPAPGQLSDLGGIMSEIEDRLFAIQEQTMDEYKEADEQLEYDALWVQVLEEQEKDTAWGKAFAEKRDADDWFFTIKDDGCIGLQINSRRVFEFWTDENASRPDTVISFGEAARMAALYDMHFNEEDQPVCNLITVWRLLMIEKCRRNGDDFTQYVVKRAVNQSKTAFFDAMPGEIITFESPVEYVYEELHADVAADKNQEKLPKIQIIDVGRTSCGLISLLRDAMGPKEEMQAIVGNTSIKQFSFNPFDVQRWGAPALQEVPVSDSFEATDEWMQAFTEGALTDVSDDELQVHAFDSCVSNTEYHTAFNECRSEGFVYVDGKGDTRVMEKIRAMLENNSLFYEFDSLLRINSLGANH